MGDQAARPGWAEAFDTRQLKEIEFSRLYATMYGHGTDGHNAKLIIARMAELLDERQAPQPAVVDDGDDASPAVRIDGLERVTSRLLTVVFGTLANVMKDGGSAAQAHVRLEVALRDEFGIESETIAGLMAEEERRRMEE